MTKTPPCIGDQIKALEKRRGGKWVTLKEALMMEANRLGLSFSQAFSRYKKGMYRDAWTIHWVNKRVVFVRVR